MNKQDYLEAMSEQRKLASAVSGTNMCVSGGFFACTCNFCMKMYSERVDLVQKLLNEVFYRT